MSEGTFSHVVAYMCVIFFTSPFFCLAYKQVFFSLNSILFVLVFTENTNQNTAYMLYIKKESRRKSSDLFSSV